MKIDRTTPVLVTGGASGLGEATARRLAALGAPVAVLDRQEDRGREVALSIGGVFAPCDVTRDDSVEAALAIAAEAHGVARIVVNCAGVAPGRRIVSKKRDTGELLGHDLAAFDQVVQINLVGTFRVMAKAALAMAALEPVDADGQRGIIVCTASVAAQDGQVGQAAYAASKGGVAALTLPAARDLASYGIRVATILPGLFWTPMFAGITEEFQKSLAANTPFPQRLGKPEEYAQLVESVVANDMLNGCLLRLDGAVRLAPR